MAFSFSLLFFFRSNRYIFNFNIFYIIKYGLKKREIGINKIVIIISLAFFAFAGFNYYNYIKADNHYNQSLNYFVSGELLGKSINEMEKSIQFFKLSDYYILHYQNYIY